MCKYAYTQYFYIHRLRHHVLSVDVNCTLLLLPLPSRKWEDAAKHWRSSVHVFPANATSHYLQGKYFQASKRGALWKNTCVRQIAIVFIKCVFILFLWDAASCLIFRALLAVPQWEFCRSSPQEVGKYNEAVECHAEQVLAREHKKTDSSILG